MTNSNVPMTLIRRTETSQPVKRRGLLNTIWRERSAYIMLAPSYIIFLLFSLIPTVAAVALSFFDADLGHISWTGLDNYFKLAQDPVFQQSVVTTIKIALIVVPLVTLGSLGMAVLIQPVGSSFQAFMRGVLYLPKVANAIVMSLIFLWMFNPQYGLINYLLSLVGIAPYAWLSQGSTAIAAVIIVEFILRVGQPFILFLAGLYVIPRELYDAASIDGANGWQSFRYVTLPMLTPITLFVVVTQTIASLQIWASVFLLTRGGPNRATDVVMFRIYETGFEFFRFGLASTQSVVLLLISAVFVIVLFRQFRWQGDYT